MKIGFVRLFAATLCLVLMLSGCKRGGEDFSSADYTSTPAITDYIESPPITSSSSSPEVTDTPIDPIPSREQSGTVVDSNTLTVKKGCQNGIDVSKWQGKIDWAKVKNSNIDFAIIRIGYRAENGNIYKDDYADYNLQQAEKNGIPTGVYFFSSAKNTAEAVEDANWTTNAIAGYPVSLVAWDCEGFKDSDSRMYGMTAKDRTDCAVAYINKVSAAGYDTACYASANDLTASVFETERLEAITKIWVAHYPDIAYPQTAAPAYNGKYDLWQHTDSGKVSGVKGDCDLVVSFYKIKSAAAKNADKRPQNVDAPSEEDKIYQSANEQVTAKDYVNLRSLASTSAEVVGELKNGEVATRTGIGTNGWSRLEYSGKTVYAISSYLTTDLSYTPPTSSESDGFTPTDDSVTAKDETNLRESPNTNSPILGTIKNGEFVKRTGINEVTGWSRLEYGGKIAYAVTRLLTDKVNEVSSIPETPSSQTETTYRQTFKDVNEQVTAKSETNLRDKPSLEDSIVIYCLKNGETVTRTGIGDMGWSRLEYGGQTVYAVTSYLQVIE